MDCAKVNAEREPRRDIDEHGHRLRRKHHREQNGNEDNAREKVPCLRATPLASKGLLVIPDSLEACMTVTKRVTGVTAQASLGESFAFAPELGHKRWPFVPRVRSVVDICLPFNGDGVRLANRSLH
jgi:hypothetical protein